MNKNITNLFLLSTLLLFVTACGAVRTTPVQTTGMSPKHEFRGVWVQTGGTESLSSDEQCRNETLPCGNGSGNSMKQGSTL